MNADQIQQTTSYDDWMASEEMTDFTEVVGEANWKGVRTDYMRWYEVIKDACGLFEVFGEEEDQTMEKYKVITGMFFAVKEEQQAKLKEGVPAKEVKLSTFQGSRHQSIVKGSGYITDVHGGDSTVRSVDQYGELTIHLLAARIRIEIVESAFYRCVLFYINILQFCLAIVVFGVGSLEMDGGQFSSALATSVAGGVAVIAAIYGILGSIGANESFLRKYLVGGFWLLAILTTFLYTEIYQLNNKYLQCTPSKSSFSPDTTENCDRDKGRHTTLIIIALAQLVVVFYGAMNTINLLDGLNDQAALETKQLFMLYMRTRFFELKQYMHTHLPDICTSRKLELLDDDLFHLTA